LFQLAINPDYICYPLSWLGHIPFASWLTTTLAPKLFVELGSYSGTSYFSFCQTVRATGISTQCFAVDTWAGDEHTGGYDEAVFKSFSAHNDANYASFSKALRMRFEDAVEQFADGTIDLLHIDGLHTYQAVKNDFETWCSKLSDVGVVLFHDTAVEREGFGVGQYWSEVSAHYPSFEFSHSNGLGVLLVGSSYRNDPGLINAITDFAPLTDRLAERLWLQQMVREKSDQLDELMTVTLPTCDAQLEQSKKLLEERSDEIARLSRVAGDLAGKAAELRRELELVTHSRTWRWRGKLLSLKNLFTKSTH
jgi:hypothetical protein